MKGIFEDIGNELLLSPKMEFRRAELEKAWSSKNYNSHIFILSSGTTSGGAIKSYALSKKSVLANAHAVNKRFSISSEDRWLSSLPKYHIGGLSIFARAFLSGSEVIDNVFKWNPETFVKLVESEGITHLSLVPTQLFDVVDLGLAAPAKLKMVFVGGDFVSHDLCKKAVALGWPIFVTYGMTECCSQVATSAFNDMEDGYIEVLPVHSLIPKETKYRVVSEALFSEMIELRQNGNIHSKYSSNFIIPDNLSVKNKGNVQFLKPLGRASDVFKISGRLYYLNDIRNLIVPGLLEMGVYNQVSLSSVYDERLGNRLLVQYIPSDNLTKTRLVELIIERTSLPKNYFNFERVQKFSRTDLGKIKRR